MRPTPQNLHLVISGPRRVLPTPSAPCKVCATCPTRPAPDACAALLACQSRSGVRPQIFNVASKHAIYLSIYLPIYLPFYLLISLSLSLILLKHVLRLAYPSKVVSISLISSLQRRLSNANVRMWKPLRPKILKMNSAVPAKSGSQRVDKHVAHGFCRRLHVNTLLLKDIFDQQRFEQVTSQGQGKKTVKTANHYFLQGSHLALPEPSFI